MLDDKQTTEYSKQRAETLEKELLSTQKKLNELSQQHEKLLEALADEVHLWKVVRDKKGDIKSWQLVNANPATLKSWAKKKEEVVGKTPDQIFGIGSEAQFRPIVEKIFKENKKHSWIKHFKPTKQYLSMSSIPLGEYFISTGRDITQEKEKQDKLKDTSELLKKAEEMANQGSFKWDIINDEWHFSENWFTIHGLSHPNVSQELLMQLSHPDDRTMINNALEKALSNQEAYNIEHRIIKKDTGEVRWVRAVAEVRFSQSGKPLSLIGLGQDITTEKLKEKALIESTDFLNKTGKIAKVGGWQIKEDFKKTFWTKGTYDIHDLPYDYDTSVEDGINFYHKDDQAMVKQYVEEAIKSGKPFEFEARILTPKGQTKWVFAKGEADTENGKCVGITGIFQDITEQKKNEAEKLKIQKQLQQITNSVPGMIYQFVFHKNGSLSIPYASERSQEILGFNLEQMTNPEFLFSRIHADDYKSTMNSILKANEDQAEWEHEFRALDRNGEVVWVRGRSKGYLDKKGDIIHSGFFADITKQKKAEEALKLSREAYQNIADNLPGMVLKYKLNPDGSDDLLYISDGVKELYEITATEALRDNRPLWKNVHPDDLEDYLKSVQTAAKSLKPWSFEHRLKFPDGRIKWVQMRGIPSKQKDGSVIFDSLGLDVSKQKEAEFRLEMLNKELENRVEERAQKAIELAKKLELYLLAAQNSKAGVWRYHVKTNALEWDDIMYDLYGIDKKDFSGAYEAWESSLHPDDLEENVAALRESIKTQKDLDILFRIKHKKSGDIRHLKGKGKVEVDSNGSTVAVFGNNWDVTDEMRLAEERKKALDELKATQSQLIQSEKMASLGILTAGVAHELNNPLNYIVGAHTAIKEHLEEQQSPNKAELKEYLSWIKSGTDRATRIIKGLNLFSRSNEDFDEACDLKKIVQDCLLMLQSKHKNRININLHFDAEDMVVKGNYGKLHQAVLNILSNAMDAIEQEGEITIHSKLEKAYLKLEFKDTGIGINKAELKKVMDPFFTTKPPGVGTGLGLYITHNIVERHKGSIQMTSQVNKGTKVTLKLPKLI